MVAIGTLRSLPISINDFRHILINEYITENGFTYEISFENYEYDTPCTRTAILHLHGRTTVEILFDISQRINAS